MKLLMMIVGAFLVLGGAGAGAYLFFQQEVEASSPVDEDDYAEVDDHDSKDSKHAQKSSKKGGHGDDALKFSQYVKLDPLILPIVDDSGVSQVVSVVIALEVTDALAAETVRGMAPKLKDAYIQDLYGMLSEHAALKGGVVQVGYIKKRLSDISDRVMSDGEIHNVLLQVVQQRPI